MLPELSVVPDEPAVGVVDADAAVAPDEDELAVEPQPAATRANARTGTINLTVRERFIGLFPSQDRPSVSVIGLRRRLD